MLRWLWGARGDAVSGEGEDAIVRIVAIELNASEADVRRVHSFRRDLKMDSVAAATILFSIEEEFGVSFEGVQVGKIDTLVELQRAIDRASAGEAKR